MKFVSNSLESLKVIAISHAIDTSNLSNKRLNISLIKYKSKIKQLIHTQSSIARVSNRDEISK